MKDMGYFLNKIQILQTVAEKIDNWIAENIKFKVFYQGDHKVVKIQATNGQKHLP